MHFDQINAALMRIKDNIKQTDPNLWMVVYTYFKITLYFSAVKPPTHFLGHWPVNFACVVHRCSNVFFSVTVGSSLRCMVLDQKLLSSSSQTLYHHVRGKSWWELSHVVTVLRIKFFLNWIVYVAFDLVVVLLYLRAGLLWSTVN